MIALTPLVLDIAKLRKQGKKWSQTKQISLLRRHCYTRYSLCIDYLVFNYNQKLKNLLHQLYLKTCSAKTPKLTSLSRTFSNIGVRLYINDLDSITPVTLPAVTFV